MELAIKSALYIAAFALGVVADWLALMLFVRATYSCTPSPIQPCDAGPMLAVSLWVFTAPIAGLLFVYFTHRLIARHKASRAAGGNR
jgi:hypothetical protein